MPAEALDQVYAEKLRLNPGAERLISTAQAAGIKVLLVSGGFTFFTDRLRERRWHLGIPLLMAAAGLSLAALAPTSAWLVMGGLVIAGMGASAALPMFWQLPPAFLSSATLAAGIALISSFGSIAAFLAPYLIGWMRDTTQSASLALYLLAILIALGAGLVLRTPAAVVNPR